MADLQMKTIRYPGINNLYRFMQPDGTYPDLTAGNIISNDAYNEDTEPYLFRALPYKSKRLEEDLVGATVNWNQQIQNVGDTMIFSDYSTVTKNVSENSFTLSWTIASLYTYGIFNDLNAIKDHVYIIGAYVELVSGSAPRIIWAKASNLDSTPNTPFVNKSYHFVMSKVATTNGSPIIGATWDNEYIGTSSELKFKGVVLIDLTAFFGNATIADAIYAMEQANAGSGVAFMRKYFSDVFTANYDTGTLKSVNPTAHKTVGFNQLPYIPTYKDNAGIRDFQFSGDCVRLIAGKQYEFNFENISNATSWRIAYISFDLNGSRLSHNVLTNVTTSTSSSFSWYDYQKAFLEGGNSTSKWVRFTAKEDCYIYFTFGVGDASSSSIMSKPCLHWGGERNGEYEPYVEHTYDLGNVPLYGLFQLENGKLKAYGDVRHAEGGTDRKFGLLDMGTLDWYYQASNHSFRLETSIGAVIPTATGKVANLICSKYPTAPQDALGSADKVIMGLNWRNGVIVIDSSYSDAATFKTAMSGVMLCYEKATTTTEDTASFEKIQSCFPYGTEQYITTNDVPVGHDTKYYTDLAKKIADLPFDMSMIAPIEDTYTATRNYAVGDYLIVDNTFYKVTSAIANGGAITPNTNVTATTVATELIALR